MAQTTREGTNDFPVTVSEYLDKVVETIARQDIKALKSANVIADGFKRIEVKTGTVLEQVVIKMAESRAFDRDAYDRAPVDPVVAVKYHNNWKKRQFQVTLRDDDIEDIIANKGQTVEDTVASILESLTQGEGNEENLKQLELLFKADIKDYAIVKSKKPKTMRGCIYMLRDMYNHCKYNNNDLTEHEFVSSVPDSDIRIAMSSDFANLLNVDELADIFNLSKVELMGKLVIFDVETLRQVYPEWTEDDFENVRYKVFAYDINAMIIGEKARSLESERVAKGKFTNFYLNVRKCYAHSGLFKATVLDCKGACLDALAELVEEVSPQTFEITKTLTHATTNIGDSVTEGDAVYGSIKADTGYHFDDQSTIKGTMGEENLTKDQIYYDAKEDAVIVNIANATGNIKLIVSADAD